MSDRVAIREADEENVAYKLSEESRMYRNGFEAALRWLDRDYGADARGDHSLSGLNYDDAYVNDMLDIRRARRALEARIS